MKSRLMRTDSATMTGLLTAGGVYLIYQNAVPSLADIHISPPHDDVIETARKHAAWKSAALIGVVFFVARDLNSFIISGAALVGIDYMVKHANGTNPETGKLDENNVMQYGSKLATVHPVPDDYEESA